MTQEVANQKILRCASKTLIIVLSKHLDTTKCSGFIRWRFCRYYMCSVVKELSLWKPGVNLTVVPLRKVRFGLTSISGCIVYGAHQITSYVYFRKPA